MLINKKKTVELTTAFLKEASIFQETIQLYHINRKQTNLKRLAYLEKGSLLDMAIVQ
ncbi:hypothetical protein ACW5YJ_12090 [Staphylococcus sp. mip270_02]